MGTHCVNGHEWTAANTYARPDGGRRCRACSRERVRACRWATLDPGYVNEWNANMLAIRLRDRGLSYPAISAAIEEVHGVRRSAGGWRHWLRKMGAVPKPRGVLPVRVRG